VDTDLEEHLKAKEFQEASLLLQKNLEKGELLDPRIDQLWAPIADTISAHIEKENGLDATIRFWKDLLDFFESSIEQRWGHAHKGHIYFRLGLHVAKHDLVKAREYLFEARQEDILRQGSLGGTEEEIAARAQESSSHVALALIEKIKEKDFQSPEEQVQFFDNIFGPSFDAAIYGKIVSPDIVKKAIASITPQQVREICFSLYKELSIAAIQHLPFATVSLTGTVLESIILGILKYQNDIITLSNGMPILEAELGPLMNEAITRDIFPSTTVKSTMRLVYLFRNRLHPGNEIRQENKLTNRVSITLKIMFEKALVDWSHNFINGGIAI
jgi:hypothetical protein